MERRRDRLRSLRPLIVLAAVVLGASAFFIVAFQTRFRLHAGVVPSHLLLVSLLLAATLSIVAAVQAALRRRTRLVALPIAGVVAALTLLDVVHWIGRTVWVEEMSLRTLVYYAPRIYAVAAGATQVPGLWWLGGTLVAAALAFAAVLWCASPLAGAVASAVDPERAAVFGRANPGAAAFMASVACAGALAAAYWTIAERDALHAEPLTALFPGIRRVPDAPAAAAVRVPALDIDRDGAEPDANPIPVRPGRKNVVIVVIDSLRPEHVSAFGYRRTTTPALDAFVAAEPVLIADWATSTCSISGCGILSILGSAQYRRQQAGMVTLPGVLAAAGYETYFISSSDFTRAYPVLSQLFGETARMFVDGFSRPGYAPNDDRHIVEALADVPSYQGTPAFLYFHLHSIHQGSTRYREPTYRPSQRDTAVWAAFMKAQRDGTAMSADPPRDIDATVALNDYDNAVLQADDVLARILGGLSEKRWLDDAVVVITSDHGEAFGEHGRQGHGHDLHAESIDIPLVIRDSTMSATRRVPYARHVDVAPTVLDCLGLEVPASWEGRSLLSGSASVSFHETTHQRPIRAVVWRGARGTYKYIVDTKSGQELLFDLQRDPSEHSNVLDVAPPDVVAIIRDVFRKNFEAPP